MKAKDLRKKSESISSIFERIEDSNQMGQYKIFIPHFMYVDDSVKNELINNGFKLYRGDWDGIHNDALIIEW